MDFYNEIFKRKSYHLFVGGDKPSEEELEKVNAFIKNVKPLYDDIKTEIVIVPESETTCHRGADFCVLFYSENKGEYLRNIGYIGEQIDLYLASLNLGALWFGIGKPKQERKNGLEYVIMIAFKKMPENSFRKDMYKSKRKEISEIWSGEIIEASNIIRFAPSACNTQPWYVENKGDELDIYRCKKPGKRGIMPVDKVMYYNRIDIGIFLYFLETCLNHENVCFVRELFNDLSDSEVEKTLVAKYKTTSQDCLLK